MQRCFSITSNMKTAGNTGDLRFTIETSQNVQNRYIHRNTVILELSVWVEFLNWILITGIQLRTAPVLDLDDWANYCRLFANLHPIDTSPTGCRLVQL